MFADIIGLPKRNNKVKAELGITFDYEHEITASVLKSGIMVIERVREEKEAFDFYSKASRNFFYLALRLGLTFSAPRPL